MVRALLKPTHLIGTSATSLYIWDTKPTATVLMDWKRVRVTLQSPYHWQVSVTYDFLLLKLNVASCNQPDVQILKFECFCLRTRFCCAVQNIVPTHSKYGDVLNELENADFDEQVQVTYVLHSVSNCNLLRAQCSTNLSCICTRYNNLWSQPVVLIVDSRLIFNCVVRLGQNCAWSECSFVRKMSTFKVDPSPRAFDGKLALFIYLCIYTTRRCSKLSLCSFVYETARFTINWCFLGLTSVSLTLFVFVMYSRCNTTNMTQVECIRSIRVHNGFFLDDVYHIFAKFLLIPRIVIAA